MFLVDCIYLLSRTRIFYSYWNVIIAGEGLQFRLTVFEQWSVSCHSPGPLFTWSRPVWSSLITSHVVLWAYSNPCQFRRNSFLWFQSHVGSIAKGTLKLKTILKWSIPTAQASDSLLPRNRFSARVLKCKILNLRNLQNLAM